MTADDTARLEAVVMDIHDNMISERDRRAIAQRLREAQEIEEHRDRLKQFPHELARRLAVVEDDLAGVLRELQRLQPDGSPCPGRPPMLAAWIVREQQAKVQALEASLQRVEQLVADLQRHSKEQGWQDVDEPIAALLALATSTREDGRHAQ